MKKLRTNSLFDLKTVLSKDKFTFFEMKIELCLYQVFGMFVMLDMK